MDILPSGVFLLLATSRILVCEVFASTLCIPCQTLVPDRRLRAVRPETPVGKTSGIICPETPVCKPGDSGQLDRRLRCLTPETPV
jgi:hypothetical protein